MALLGKIASSIRDGESDDALGIWKRALLNAPLTFVKIERKDDLQWKRINEREAFGHLFDTMY